MKAYVLEGIDNLVFKEVEKPIPEEGWALVKVKASGICSSDIPRIFTKGTYHFPTIPGHEFSGIVESVGKESDKEWKGKNVSVFPLIPCGKCCMCKEKKFEMCEDYDYIGSRRDGAFAEYVLAPIWNLLEIPRNADFIKYAMMEPLSVALHATRKANINSTDNVTVVGTGMIGLAIATWSKKMGANTVTVVGRSQSKRKLVENCGLKYATTDENSIRKANVTFEVVGSELSIKKSINITSPGGRIIFVGNPAGNIMFDQNTYWRILRKQLTITGSWNSSFKGEIDDWIDARNAIEKDEINPLNFVTNRFPADKLKEGLNLMKEHTKNYCKVMIEW